ncbi:MAG: hypothetical protein QW348_07585 [Ignisphaera sp.]
MNGTAEVSVKSPRFIARNVTDVTSTIKALYWLARDIPDGKPELTLLMARTVNIDLADFLGTILINDKPAKAIVFGDLLSVEIIPAGGQGDIGNITTSQPSTSQPQSTTSIARPSTQATTTPQETGVRLEYIA